VEANTSHEQEVPLVRCYSLL